MCATVLAFPVAEATIHCGECRKGIDPEHQFATECIECGAWMCKRCDHCDCDRLALIVKRSLDRQTGVWTRDPCIHSRIGFSASQNHAKDSA
jgi:hypothetical protein